MTKIKALGSLMLGCQLSANLLSSQLHITDSSVCQKVMEDHNKLATKEEKSEFLFNLKTSAEKAKEKYTAAKDTVKVQKVTEIEQCITFLNTFPDYLARLKEVKPLFDQIAPQKAPSAIVSKTIEKHASGLDTADAWNLYNCEPCQKVKQECLKEDGSFDKEKTQHLSSLAWYFRIRKRENDYGPTLCSRPLAKEEMMPESLNKKAEVLQACVDIIDAKMESEKQASKAEEYLK